MATVLFDNGVHRCIVFNDILHSKSPQSRDIQANQFLIIHKEEGAIIDPGGTKLFESLRKEVSNHVYMRKITKLLLSHQDPDTGAGANPWVLFSSAKLYISQLWSRFVPHFFRQDFPEDIFISIPDGGMKINHNGSEIIAIPAHFLHSPGNFHFYDTTSKILFSGDLGASIIPDTTPYTAVTNFDEHIKYMEGFHKRYIASQKINRLWGNMVKQLDIEMIVPQHGLFFQGKESVNRFIDWIINLPCGVDLVDENNYKIPS